MLPQMMDRVLGHHGELPWIENLIWSTVLNCLLYNKSGLQHGVIRPDEPYGLPLDFTTLQEALKKAGKKLFSLYIVLLTAVGEYMHTLYVGRFP